MEAMARIAGVASSSDFTTVVAKCTFCVAPLLLDCSMLSRKSALLLEVLGLRSQDSGTVSPNLEIEKGSEPSMKSTFRASDLYQRRSFSGAKNLKK
jgi:hypothetical protein